MDIIHISGGTERTFFDENCHLRRSSIRSCLYDMMRFGRFGLMTARFNHYLEICSIDIGVCYRGHLSSNRCAGCDRHPRNYRRGEMLLISYQTWMLPTWESVTQASFSWSSFRPSIYYNFFLVEFSTKF